MKELTVSAVLSKLFVLLVIKPDFSTLVAVFIVALIELLINHIKRVDFLTVAYFFIAAMLTVIKLKDFLVREIYEGSGDTFFAITLILALVFGVVSGAKGVLRGSLIIGVFFIVSFLFTIFGNVKEFSVPVVSVSFMKVLGDTALILVFSPEILLFEKREKGYIIISNTVLLIAFFVTMAVLGNVATAENFPYYMAGTLAKISVFSRLDAVHSALWVLMGYFKGCLLLNGVKEEFKSKNY